MSEGWKEVKLTDLGKIGRGKSKHRPRWAEHLYGGPYPFIQTGDIRNSEKYITNYTQTYSDEGLMQSKLWPKGTLCITIAANIAELAILKIPACFPDSVIGFTANEDVAVPDFVYYLLCYFQQRVQSQAIGSVQDNINLGTFDRLEFLVPPLGKQQKISNLLSSLDDKIHLLRQQNATLEAMAQALFKSWFVDFDPVIDNALAAGRDLPEALAVRVAKRRAVLESGGYPKLPEEVRGLFPGGFVFSEALGRWVPEGWEVKAISDLVNTISETFRLKEVNEVIFLNTGDIQNGKFLHREYSITSNLPGQAKKSIQKGDILYSEIRPKNKRFAFVNFDAQDYVVSTKLMVLRSTGIVDAKFIYHFLTQQNVVNRLQTLAESRSGTFPQITFDVLSTISLILPVNKEVIEVFNKKCLFDQLAKTSAIRKEIETLTRLRDVLLPELISGRVKV